MSTRILKSTQASILKRKKHNTPAPEIKLTKEQIERIQFLRIRNRYRVWGARTQPNKYRPRPATPKAQRRKYGIDIQG